MILRSVLLTLVVVELVALSVAVPLMIGRDRIESFRGELSGRVSTALPALAVLGSLLVVNSVARIVGQDISWLIGWNVTPYIHRLEGGFVASVQSVASPPLTAYFSAIYVYGYVFLLLFPVIAYLFYDDDAWLRRLVVAITVNYVVGLCFYVLFVSYGPRNSMPLAVESLLYTFQPSIQLLTGEINQNTNVFPSLHTSLSATVALLAYQTRSTYSRWFYLAVFLALSVVFSTMYLGIHWASDVLVGILLAILSVRVASKVVSQGDRDPPSIQEIRSIQ